MSFTFPSTVEDLDFEKLADLGPPPSCNSCKNLYDTDSRLPHELECGHTTCTRCLDTILMSDKKCKDCNKEIDFTNVAGVPLSLSMLRMARLKELEPPNTSSMKHKATKNMGTIKRGKKHLQMFDSRNINREDFNKRSQNASKAKDEKKSIMEEASVGTCIHHSHPVIGYCQTCNKVACKDCLIFDHYRVDGRICLVTSIVSMTKLFTKDCNDTIVLNEIIIEFHKFRIEAFNIYLEKKLAEFESNEQGTNDITTMERFYDDLLCMVLDTREHLDELLRALHFYKVEVNNLRCTDKLSCDLREISHSIDSIENHLYPVEIFAKKFCKLCPDFSYRELFSKISMDDRRRLRYVIAALSNSLKLNEFECKNIFSEEILVQVMGKHPEVVQFSHSMTPEFLSTYSEKQLSTFFRMVVKYNRVLLARLAILPGEEIINCGRNIWIEESTKAFQGKVSGQSLATNSDSKVKNDSTSQQDNFHLLGARPKIIPKKSSRKSGSKAIKSQVLPSSSKQDNPSGSTKTNENVKKPAINKKNLQTPSHHNVFSKEPADFARAKESTRKGNKSPICSLPKKTTESFSALTSVLTPSLAFIIATSPVELADIDSHYTQFFQIYSLGKLFESMNNDTEVDINTFKEQKLLHEKRLKCYKQVDLFEECLNPFTIFDNDIFKYSAPKTPPKENYKREEDVALPKSSASQSGYEASQREQEDRKREHEDSHRECEASQKECEASQKECEASQRDEEIQSEYEASQRDEEIQSECEANQREDEASQREDEASQREDEASQREDEASRREDEASRREDEASQRDKENQSENEANHRDEEIPIECVAGRVVNKERRMEFEVRQREYDEDQRELNAIQKEWEAIQMKRRLDIISPVPTRKKTKDTSGKPVYCFLTDDPISAVALPFLSKLAPFNKKEETNPRLSPRSSDDIGVVPGTGSSCATKQSEEELNENLHHQNSIKDEQRFKTQDKSPGGTLDPTDTLEYTFMPNIQTGASQTTISKIAETRDNGGSGPEFSIQENLGPQKALAKAKQLCKEHDLDNSYVPYLTSMFARLIPPSTETALSIVNHMEKFRVPPILPPTGEINVIESGEKETESICCVRPHLTSLLRRTGFKIPLPKKRRTHDAQRRM
ncbi:uncharacterized protein LOC135205667 isoform X2 [Macrobrachium nipponense]|uniref:uncharacterized protein LOC135205667 isoform X2 n=1 Tax=Macrobrachium nipponense TaxID=159736 RepID=UPI0030C7AA65